MKVLCKMLFRHLHVKATVSPVMKNSVQSVKIWKYIRMIMKSWLRLIFRSGCQEKQVHCANVKHQYKVLDSVKKNLGEDELLIRIDFSENFAVSILLKFSQPTLVVPSHRSRYTQSQHMCSQALLNQSNSYLIVPYLRAYVMIPQPYALIKNLQ
ncbi:hypothetical protein PR048_022164 [Dryococelus australis]|uniref:Uncharacterized protein n=1 Tax=Dryococelus australis TaxID=614101 RepID=A0ABQ9H080_9NEOP|nr:hypothetical protein PR048_022164 [Dryococelus australis]